jgi:hypothetical protein
MQGIQYPASLSPEARLRLAAALRRASGIAQQFGPRKGPPVRSAGPVRSGASLWDPVHHAAASGSRAPHSSLPGLQARD